MMIAAIEATPSNPLGIDYAAELAFNARLFELARHNGYATATFHTGTYCCWTVPEQLLGVVGGQVAVLP